MSYLDQDNDWFLLGKQCYEKEDFSGAISYFKKISAKSFNFPEALIFLGFCYAKINDQKKANLYFKRLLSITGEVRALDYLALFYEHEHELERAIMCSKKAIHKDPSDDVAWNNLAREHAEKKDFDTAEHCIRVAISINPTQYEYRINYALILAMAKKINESINELEDILAIDDTNEEAWMALGEAYSELGDKEKALAAFANAANIDPGDNDVYFKMGILFFEQGHFKEALQHFKQAAKLNPAAADTWYNLALCYDSLEQCTDALSSAKKAVELSPNNEEYGAFFFCLKEREAFKKKLHTNLKKRKWH